MALGSVQLQRLLKRFRVRSGFRFRVQLLAWALLWQVTDSTAEDVSKRKRQAFLCAYNCIYIYTRICIYIYMCKHTYIYIIFSCMHLLVHACRCPAAWLAGISPCIVDFLFLRVCTAWGLSTLAKRKVNPLNYSSIYKPKRLKVTYSAPYRVLC